MKTFVKSAFLALSLAVAGLAASAPAAGAGGLSAEFRIGGNGGGVIIRDHRDPRDHRGGQYRPVRPHHGGWDRYSNRRPRFDGCAPDFALGKAASMGYRHVEIAFIGPRRVAVHGYRHGRPAQVIFLNDRFCPVLAIR